MRTIIVTTNAAIAAIALAIAVHEFQQITELEKRVTLLESENKKFYSFQEYDWHQIWRLQKFTKMPNANGGYPVSEDSPPQP